MVSEIYQQLLIINATISALQSKAEGTPTVKQVGSFTHCSNREHTPWGAVGCLSKRMLEFILGFGLWLANFGEGLRK